jgi:paraquat-inducible protein B
MAEDVKYFKLGLFFLSSVGLLVAGIIFLGAMDYFRPTFTVETYFSIQSVTGLEIGAPVKITGVTKGKVTEIENAGLVYLRDEIVEAAKAGNLERTADNVLRRAIVVRMEIVVDERLQDLGDLRRDLYRTMVDQGLRARLSQSGLAGPVFINLEYVDPEIYPVPELPWEPRYFWVPSAPGVLSEFMNSATAILSRIRRTDFSEALEKLDRVFQVVNEFSEDIDVTELREDMITLMDDVQNAGRQLREFVNDPRFEQTLSDFSETVSGTMAALKGRSEDLGSTLEAIPRTAARLERVAARTEELVEDERIDQILEGMSQAAGSAGDTMDNAEATTAELRRLVRELSRLTMVLNEDLNVITENLRRVTEDAEVITGEIRDNPSRLFLGKEPPHFDPAKPGEQEQER